MSIKTPPPDDANIWANERLAHQADGLAKDFHLVCSDLILKFVDHNSFQHIWSGGLNGHSDDVNE
jgi:hypothetical protein